MSDNYTKGPLTEIEAAAITGFFHENLSLEEINEKLNRSPKSVAVKNAYDELVQKNAIQVAAAEPLVESSVPDDFLLDSMGETIVAAMSELQKRGIPLEKAEVLIEKALDKVNKSSPPSLETFLSYCLSTKSHISLFGGKRIGSSAAFTQTQAASSTPVREATQSRVGRESVWRPKDHQ